MFDSLFSSYIANISALYINLMYVCAILSELLKLNIVFIGLFNYIFNAFLRRNASFHIPQRLNLECHLVVKERISIRINRNVLFKIQTWKKILTKRKIS